MKIDVLVVDDDSFDRRILQRALKTDVRFSEALEADCADKGFDMATQLSAGSVVVTDLRMPIVDGFELIARLKADERTKNLQVLAMSSSNAEQDRASALKVGAADFETKPMCKAEFPALTSKVAALAGLAAKAGHGQAASSGSTGATS